MENRQAIDWGQSIVCVVCTESAVLEAACLVEMKEKANRKKARRRYSAADMAEAGARTWWDCDMT